MKQLQRVGGIFAIILATLYITAFIIYGAILEYPSNPDSAQELFFLKNNQLILSVSYLLFYVLFGILLSVLILAIKERMIRRQEILSKMASVFGFLWVGLVISSGMIGSVGLAAIIRISADAQENAIIIWTTISVIVEGLGGGNEIVGGLWVLLLSIAGLKSNSFSKGLNYLGLSVGIVGILTVYPEELFTEIFGLSQIVWFIWLGTSMLASKPTS